MSTEVTFVWFLVLVSILIIFILLLEKRINKLLGVKKKKLSETPGKKIEKWSRIIISVLYFLGTVIFILYEVPFLDMNEAQFLKFFLILYLTVSLGSHAFLEWKYIKESKQYVTTLILLIFLIGVVYIFAHFFLSVA